ncbi:MAG: 5'/3'-nucleotidase SurE, partial [Dehalococcoidia bacterium]|nr:5'/3'-nucleotidase SurE [Dehalococcoidia bacterium]
GLWALVEELRKIAQVVVAAPDKGHLAMGTAVSDIDRKPLRLKKVRPVIPEVETYCIKGTPVDSVILALCKLIQGRIDLIISGINRGTNVETDVFASGTVGAALLGHLLRGLPALSISLDRGDKLHFDVAAKLAAVLASRIESGALPNNIFLNVNLPNLPLTEIKGIKITYLANGVYTDTVEEGYDEKGIYFQTKRYRGNKATDEGTDLWAVQQGYISIVPLHSFVYPMFNKPSPHIPDSIWSHIMQELQRT